MVADHHPARVGSRRACLSRRQRARPASPSRPSAAAPPRLLRLRGLPQHIVSAVLRHAREDVSRSPSRPPPQLAEGLDPSFRDLPRQRGAPGAPPVGRRPRPCAPPTTPSLSRRRDRGQPSPLADAAEMQNPTRAVPPPDPPWARPPLRPIEPSPKIPIFFLAKTREGIAFWWASPQTPPPTLHPRPQPPPHTHTHTPPPHASSPMDPNPSRPPRRGCSSPALANEHYSNHTTLHGRRRSSRSVDTAKWRLPRPRP